MNTSTPPSFWDLVDAVLLINLDQRKDRWTKFLKSADGTIPPAKIHRISAVLGMDLPGYGIKPWFRGGKRDLTWAARAGCTLSHRRALAVARERGWQTVLILEDDVAIDPAFCGILHDIAQSLAQNDPAWQICYLGFTDPVAPCRVLDEIPPSRRLIEISGCNTAHAYLIKPRLRNWILDQLPDELSVWPWLARHRAIDRWYQTVLSRNFPVTCVSPSVLNQQPGFSDIAQRETDYLDTGDHLLHVSGPITSPVVFNLLHLLRNVSTRFAQTSDVVRGFAKRLRGF